LTLKKGIYGQSDKLLVRKAFCSIIAKRGVSMAETWNKRERERKQRQKKQAKQEKKQERKQSKGHQDWTDMLAYVDENGNLSSKPLS
jgi:hypothetical protein